MKLDIFEYRDYLKKRYGEVLYRVPIDAGFSCPHRGHDGKGGCIFCPDDGARAVQLRDIQALDQQVKAGVRFAQRRYKAKAFMAYLQAFTNTFSSVEILEDLVTRICLEHDFRAITFGTRPDCLPESVLGYLKTLKSTLDVWVELGVQTTHDSTLKRINRGHGWQESREAIEKLHEKGIAVAVHLILGLPGETPDDFLKTIKRVTALPVDAIKLHNLHVIKDTALADLYEKQPFPVFSEYEYSEILLSLLPWIPDTIPLIRLTTDSPEEKLLAPKWAMSKGQFRKFLGTQLRSRIVSQGSALRDNSSLNKTGCLVQSSPEPVATNDGSITFFNEIIKEHYHTLAGARSEAENKFCRPAKLSEKLTQKSVRILDVCFGLGYNSLVSCEYAVKTNSEVEITGLELDRRVVYTASKEIQENNTLFDWNNCLKNLSDTGQWQHQNCSIKLFWGDARHTAARLEHRFDCIWLDAFSTQKNSELWTVDFFKTLKRLLEPGGLLLTYCAAIPVRAGLIEAGFHVGETEAFGRERGGTIASMFPGLITKPLPERDLYLVQTSRGTPYRDPEGTRTNKEILRAREFEISNLKKGRQ